MKSDIIRIDNQGNGFERALEEAQKVSTYTGLKQHESVRLLLCAEEMLSMARLVTGELQASFWIETEGPKYQLHLSTQTIMDREKREQLIAASTSRKNEAARSFIGKLRDMFENALAEELNHNSDLPEDVLDDLANHTIECSDPEWDGYEQSTLKKLADTIEISIRGDKVDMKVIKTFA